MSTLRAAISGMRKVIALPIWLISGIAFLLLGFQLLLALANVLHGVSIVDALLIWIGNTVILMIVAFVAGGLAVLISGTPSEAVTDLNEGALKPHEVPPPPLLAATDSRGGRVRDMDAERQAWWIAHVAQPAVANRSEIQPGDNDRLSDEVRALWPKVVDAFMKIPPKRPLIAAARFGGVEGNVVVLAFPSEMRYLCEMGERRAESLAGTMSQVLELSVAVECRVVEPAAPRTTLAPSTDGSASPTTWTAPERELAALGYPQVARFVHSLGRLAPDELFALEVRLADHSLKPGSTERTA